ncbi:ADP-ribose glycohydrolase MACROD2 isoform 2-T2 [Anomaloglossus baeobatrachus]|uniref:ADP-ribose glycohydrolase MACROD2 isoform X2 n=1 Tax=Anomaloglossus baeobatrachus TaxID=238106 RepID=UPI003F4FCD1A
MSQTSNKKKRLWREEKERLLGMSQTDRRKELYKDYIPLDNIQSLLKEQQNYASEDENKTMSSLCDKVSLYKGDITQLEVDAIVNAANSSLLGGGGVDGCIHRASGPFLSAECRTLRGCETGKAKITCAYELPAKYVIHTVGPIARGQLSDFHKENLAKCYESSLALVKENNIRSIAFPCISTGIYGFPNDPAAIIALTTTKEWLKKNREEIDRIIFCVFLDTDYKIYKKKLNEFFLKDEDDDTEDIKKEEKTQKSRDDINGDDGTEKNKKEEGAQISKLMSDDNKGTENATSPPTKKCKAKKTDTQDKPDDEDKKPPSEETENVEDMKETTTGSNTQEMSETGQDSVNESCAETDNGEGVTPEITSCNKDSGQPEGQLNTNADVDMAEPSQDQEVSMDDNRNDEEMNIESQVQSKDFSKNTLSTSEEDESNEANQESQETVLTIDTSNAESGEISDDVYMLSQNMDRPQDGDEEQGNTAAATEK